MPYHGHLSLRNRSNLVSSTLYRSYKAVLPTTRLCSVSVLPLEYLIGYTPPTVLLFLSALDVITPSPIERYKTMLKPTTPTLPPSSRETMVPSSHVMRVPSSHEMMVQCSRETTVPSSNAIMLQVLQLDQESHMPVPLALELQPAVLWADLLDVSLISEQLPLHHLRYPLIVKLSVWDRVGLLSESSFPLVLSCCCCEREGWRSSLVWRLESETYGREDNNLLVDSISLAGPVHNQDTS